MFVYVVTLPVDFIPRVTDIPNPSDGFVSLLIRQLYYFLNANILSLKFMGKTASTSGHFY